MMKITFSRFCASGFYGEEKCRCIVCCERFNKTYNKLDEKRDWVYSRIMKGESFIVEDAKIIDLKSIPINFSKKVNLFVNCVESIEEYKTINNFINNIYIDKIKDYFQEELKGIIRLKEITENEFFNLIKRENKYKFFIRSTLSSHLNSEAITYIEFNKKQFSLSTTVKDLNTNVIDVWTDSSSGKCYLSKFQDKFISLNKKINNFYILKD